MNDTLSCWGDNGSGQASPPSGTFTAVSSGSGFTCAINTSGTAACWGDDTVGQTDAPSGDSLATIDVGDDFAIANTSGGIMGFWGNW